VGMNYLLDTHVFLWLLGDPDRIAEEALRDLANTDNRLVVSAVSAWEVATPTISRSCPTMARWTMSWA